MTLSACTSFTLLFCFANFVNWQLLSDLMGFEVVNIQVSRRSSFISEMLSIFELSHGLLLEFRLSSVLMTLFFSFTSSLKKPISLLNEEIWLWRLRRSWSRCPFSFVSLGSCCFTFRRIAYFSCILAASSGFLMRLFKLSDTQNCSKIIRPSCLFHQKQQNYHTLKNGNEFPYQYSVSDQLLILYFDYMNMMNMIRTISSILS